MAEDLIGKLLQALEDRGTRGEKISTLRALLGEFLKDGENRETILTQIQQLRKSVSDEQEDLLLEIMNFLVGWCSPHAKL
jgi:hypothetical protein